MKNIIVGLLTIVVVGLMVLTFSKGGAYHGGELGKVIEDMQKNTQIQKPEQMEVNQDKEDQEKLNALRNKAGSVGEIKVSRAYKSKCAACHGADGSGMQDGRRLMGPKIYGQSEEKLYKDLIDFKAGRKENVVMKGLLINTSEEELKEFAREISLFSSQNKESK
ncbi:MAG: cytochrome c553 [Sulfurimonas sp.]|jgi:cytochrome c553|uniref:c-type cytochrome n=1 Tax=Sulfurimonas sp. TaxID=2022749 RepID=UPI0039E348E2